MKIQHIRKNTIRHRKNNGWLQRSEQSEKPENDAKIKILKISKNCHKPSLPQGLERFSKVTPCNEKCNFFILLQNIPLLRILLMSIIPLCRDRTSLLVQLQNLLFCMRGFLSPILHFYLNSHIMNTLSSPPDKGDLGGFFKLIIGESFIEMVLHFFCRLGFRSPILHFQ